MALMMKRGKRMEKRQPLGRNKSGKINGKALGGGLAAPPRVVVVGDGRMDRRTGSEMATPPSRRLT